jgi:hypothetical protein
MTVNEYEERFRVSSPSLHETRGAGSLGPPATMIVYMITDPKGSIITEPNGSFTLEMFLTHNQELAKRALDEGLEVKQWDTGESSSTNIHLVINDDQSAGT